MKPTKITTHVVKISGPDKTSVYDASTPALCFKAFLEELKKDINQLDGKDKSEALYIVECAGSNEYEAGKKAFFFIRDHPKFSVRFKNLNDDRI
jgi:hypothetical protein